MWCYTLCKFELKYVLNSNLGLWSLPGVPSVEKKHHKPCFHNNRLLISAHPVLADLCLMPHYLTIITYYSGQFLQCHFVCNCFSLRTLNTCLPHCDWLAEDTFSASEDAIVAVRHCNHSAVIYYQMDLHDTCWKN